MRRLFVLPIRFYQKYISVHLGAHCRFTPTCSAYAVTAITRFGVLKGLWLSLRRVVRCNPFGGYGSDPVPETWEAYKQKRNAQKRGTR